MRAAEIPSDLKWSVRKRLEFIEHELFWSGQLKRQTVIDKTGVSRPQVSLDIAQYKELAENNMTYSLSDKTYYVTDTFKPVFIDTAPETFLLQQVGQYAEHVTFPLRHVSPDHLRVIQRAIEKKSWVTIDYSSLSQSTTRHRIIAPHHYVHDGRRWHVRAYDFASESFRDFVLGRIGRTVETQPSRSKGKQSWNPRHDKGWNTKVSLILRPHPDLPEDKQEIVALDYEMKAGQAVLKVRQACLFYVIGHMRLLDPSPNPYIQQVVLENREEILTLLEGQNV
ncbi:WYL domain-containing protein [Desulfuromonas acetoxidans]|uniref:Uncharacterized protein n=1 Tax=Desulfuromonas acetoxidans (strain DSM 684 / 11070) TaxID=281689 RepID=Q1K3L1_DESA6|nr:WYL domain-containing protein [Desulfuromonas acetoxidans]EAT16963.1 conserved hypothetical protein [Desulfuromonas acetoxidans DSM 684]MBF0644506.1 WYL domain-containing protein [Desulfuromonas acetoxidans]NVD23967.1 WYL domain-containing protein [Desulfuromonas acetoxidans]NVE16264.1 WYL domain-containing protein [Desulfuromonas acetoxidans]